MHDRITGNGTTVNGIMEARTTDVDSPIATMKYAGAIGETTGMIGIATTSIAATATAITTVAVTSATATN
jgi:hypothetical protein